MDDFITRDNVSIALTVQLYYKIIDVEKMFKNKDEYLAEIKIAVQTTLRDTVGTITLDELRSDGNGVAKRLHEFMNLKTEPIGITISSIEI
ncbi:MAG: SPFH domain-containing protein [Candidatus Thorarchaeota archaeon]